jgi:hypothetical protein
MANTKCSYFCVRHCVLVYARRPDARCSHAPLIKNGTIYKNSLQQAMVQFCAIDQSADLADFM